MADLPKSANDIAPDGPFKIELKIAFTNVGGDVGEVTYTLPPGRVPTAEEIRLALADAGDFPALAEYRLMTRHEFVDAIFAEKTGQTGFAIPGPDTFNLVEAG